MRVIGGTHGGRKLLSPKDDSVRPTSDKVKEAVFSMLQPIIQGVDFLDVFGGGGGITAEALSRGANSALIGDMSDKSVKLIRQNLDALGLGDRAQVCRCGYEALIRRAAQEERKFGAVYIDPPYASGYEPKVMQLLTECGVLEQDAWVLVEHDARKELIIDTKHYIIKTVKRYGDTAITVFGVQAEDIQ